MNDMQTEELLSSVFSDGTSLFLSPAEPNAGEQVTVRLRAQKDAAKKVTLLLGVEQKQLPMEKKESDSLFDWFEVSLTCGEGTLYYTFALQGEGWLIVFDRLGARFSSAVSPFHPMNSFRLIPGFHVPAWSKGAVQYQIFTDRFLNGDEENDVREREYAYARGMIRHYASWENFPEQDDYRRMYGGDLVGVLQKLDYLQSLGVEAIYFNPIFVSPSPHKYDTQDYEHIDPHFTKIAFEEGDILAETDSNNAHASLYINRTTNEENLKKSDEWFANFCEEVHRRGMKIILDGVFNHCGSFHRWMNREGLYEGEQGAFGNLESPYRDYFSFEDAYDYHCWWGVETLPKLHYEQSEALKDAIMKVGEKWASAPYQIDGWRLDVAADLGESREANHAFWKEFRRRVKKVNPELVIIAEHYGDPSEWLYGDEWDSVMNYDAFMEPVTFFLTGMEKHSDYRRDDLYQNGDAFFTMIFEAMSKLPSPSVYCAMDELSNHDHSRFLTRTNGMAGRLQSVGREAASEGIHPEVFREAALLQMTWPGAPTIYYGDEAGLTGWTDPDNRRPYPWGKEDNSLIQMYRDLSSIRAEYPVLKTGSVKKICSGFGFISYARFNEEGTVIVVCNNSEDERTFSLPVKGVGVSDGSEAEEVYLTSDKCLREKKAIGKVANGALEYFIPAKSAAILSIAKRA